MSNEKIYIGKVEAKENKFGGVETNISFGPKDWEKLGINCAEWKNFVLKSNKEGKPYLELNTWQPKQAAAEESLPF
jgi:hypothetical protein